MLSTQRVVIVIPKRTPDCPEPRAFQKKICTKKHIAIPMTRARDKRLTCPKGIWRFHGESVRGLSSLMRERFVS